MEAKSSNTGDRYGTYVSTELHLLHSCCTSVVVGWLYTVSLPKTYLHQQGFWVLIYSKPHTHLRSIFSRATRTKYQMQRNRGGVQDSPGHWTGRSLHYGLFEHKGNCSYCNTHTITFAHEHFPHFSLLLTHSHFQLLRIRIRIILESGSGSASEWKADPATDPHQSQKTDPNPHQSEKTDPNPHQSQKSDPNQHQSEKTDSTASVTRI